VNCAVGFGLRTVKLIDWSLPALEGLRSSLTFIAHRLPQPRPAKAPLPKAHQRRRREETLCAALFATRNANVKTLLAKTAA